MHIRTSICVYISENILKNGCHFVGAIFRFVFLYENCAFSIQTSVAFVSKGLIKTSPPSAAYMHQWTGSALVQIITCHLLGTKPLHNQCLVIVKWTLRNNLQWNFNQIQNFHSQKCIWKCKSAVILSRGRWVNNRWPLFQIINVKPLSDAMMA